MSVFGKRKSERILDTVSERLVQSLSEVLHDTVAEVLAAKGKPRHTGIRRGAVALGGLAALTAGSAGISTLRRSQDAGD